MDNASGTRSGAFNRRTLMKQIRKRQIEDRIKYMSSVAFLIMFMSCIISLMNDWRRPFMTASDHFMYISLILHRFLKLSLKYQQRLQSLTLWEVLWNSRHFHSLLFETSLYISGLTPLLILVKNLLYSLRKSLRLFHEEIAPRLGDLSDEMKENSKHILDNQYIKYFEKCLEFCYLPYLMVSTVVRFSGKCFMSLLVNIFVFAPFYYLNDKCHQGLWKELNIAVTQFAFDNTKVWSGKMTLKLIAHFQTFTDIISLLYQEDD